ncbi:probable ubiquitin-like-specific protease 2B isoform X2 [Ziziphus jujuba]|uniref:Ubiquitin-like protease family profile domain-containing protein n=2 Tax=Ziziphus jujuba TaxID=326968 RepID=A0A978VA10_ZIZJJ|nr:probable ubiquitin-like-specific protease 2B isoform X2 [Ziziphus jujuba]KAH7524745.1 hypothetical protein FEM48_Zijuj06G0152000 [Ziziphus jujuba var. spinosa]
MRSSPRRGLEVFDFKEEDELTESVAGKYMDKFKSTGNDNHSGSKHEFLECDAQGTNDGKKEIGSVPCMDIDAVERDLNCGNAISYAPLGIAEEKKTNMKELCDAASLAEGLNHEQHSELKLDNQEFTKSLPGQENICSIPRAPSCGHNQSNGACSHSPSDNEPVDMISDADESTDQSSPSSPEIAMDGVSPSNYESHHCAGDLEMDDMKSTIVLYPDYVVYRDSYCTGLQLTFSHNSIKITGSTACENQKSFNFQWEIDDVIHIETQWYQRVSTVMIKLRVISKDAGQDDDASGTSGVEELKITAVEPNWPEKQEDIACLNAQYMTMWNVVNIVMGTDGDSPGQRHYFPRFDESFEDVIYPKGDSDAVSISKRDVDLLQPETFINDTIIDFYIKYLKNQIPPEERHRFHFFNSFFFRKLADLDKDPSSVSDGKAAFQRVRKWTRKVDLFGKDYIFIPINFNLHWSLIVICHPGDVAKFKDGDIDKSVKVPCILHMDSIKGSHTGLKNLVQSYLWEEWKERQKETSDEVALRFQNMRFVPLELPQQENSFDCGLFLLHYLELFLAEAPAHFSPFKITKPSSFLNMNWFLPSEASLKRTLIQRLIFELVENHSRKICSAAFSDDDQSSKFPESNGNEIGVEFFSQRCSPDLTHQEDLTCSEASRGIEMTLLAASSMKNSQSANDSGLVLRDLFEPGATAGALLEQYQTFDQKSSYFHLNGAMPPGEEDAETGEHFVFLPPGDSGFHQITGIPSQTCGVPHSSSGYGAETFNVGISLQAENGDVDSSSEPSLCASDDSEEVGIMENCPVEEDLDPNQKVNTDKHKSPPIENVQPPRLVSASCDLDAVIVGDSQDHDLLNGGNENGGPLPSCQEIADKEVHQDSKVAENSMVSCNNMQQMIDDGLLPESHESPPAKRVRLTPPPPDGEILAIGSVTEDFHL